MGKFIDLTNERFGKLKVIKRVENNEHNQVCWLCRCDCGNEKIIIGQSLKSGATTSCGCLQKNAVKEFCKKSFTTHGMAKTRLNNVYHNMKARCNNKYRKEYKNYGARGISVCEAWNNNFKIFYDWAMANGYKEDARRGECTLDRIDVNGDYEPNNCRWITNKKNCNNKRNNCYIVYNNEKHTMSEWAEIKKIKISTLSMRINKYKWSIERALETK